MTSRRFRGLLLSCCLLAPPAWSLSASETVDAFHKALRTGKVEAAVEYLGPEAVVFEQGFINPSRAEYVSTQLQQAADFASRTERQVIRREAWQDGNIAWVLSSTMTVGIFDGRKVELEGAETMVMRKDGEGWKITHIHWSAHPIQP